MLIHEFAGLLKARPFEPFRIVTSDGRSALVKSPEFAWHAPASRIVWVASPRGGDRVRMIDLQMVTQFIIGGTRRNGVGVRKRRPEK